MNLFDKSRAEPSLLELCRDEKSSIENRTWNRSNLSVVRILARHPTQSGRLFCAPPYRNLSYSGIASPDNAWIMPCDFNWIDIGNWASVYDYTEGKDGDGNVVFSSPNLLQDCSGVLAFSTDKSKLLAIKGLDDYVVVDTPDALLICPKNDSDVKAVLSGLAMPEYERFR